MREVYVRSIPESEKHRCPRCFQKTLVVYDPKENPNDRTPDDGTTHICHPALKDERTGRDGCNTGFTDLPVMSSVTEDPELPEDKTPIPINVVVNVVAQDLKDLIITAVEGGSNYWMNIKPRSYRPNAGAVTVREDESSKPGVDGPGEWIDVTYMDIARGLELCSTKAPRVFGRWIEDHAIDANDADVVFQLAVLGEEIYG